MSKREIIDKYRLRRRPYLGTTSMDPELSFIMANMVQVRGIDRSFLSRCSCVSE